MSVEIKHTYIRDLMVELIAPSGDSVIVHNRSGGSADDIVRAYDLMSTAALENLLGQAIQGNWSLRIRDLEGQDAGTLEKWALRLAYLPS
ncbi:MAG: proprotein convertase P-domain-containing protein [Candidatus Tectomicrobia bacterium]|nr:proprotein convertase P-domain-containing protein [Candidatus Tectomicrobia bacterium]